MIDKIVENLDDVSKNLEDSKRHARKTAMKAIDSINTTIVEYSKVKQHYKEKNDKLWESVVEFRDFKNAYDASDDYKQAVAALNGMLHAVHNVAGSFANLGQAGENIADFHLEETKELAIKLSEELKEI